MADRKTGDEQALSDRDQTLADADQTQSDRDQSAADTDQTAAERDQEAWRDVVRFLYCHEWMHWYLKERLGRKSAAETTWAGAPAL